MEPYALAIQEYRDEDLANLLDASSDFISTLEEPEFFTFLDFLLRTCMMFPPRDGSNTCRVVVEKMREFSPRVTIGGEDIDSAELNYVTKWFTRASLDREAAKFMVWNSPTLTLRELANELFDWDSTEQTAVALENLHQAFGEIPHEEAVAMFNDAQSRNNVRAVELMAEWVKTSAPFSEAPEYLVFGCEDYPDPFANHAAGIIVGIMEKIGQKFENREMAMAMIAKDPNISTVLSDLVNENFDENIDRDVSFLLGPLNVMHRDHGCETFGGCRMLTCDCFTFTEALDDEGWDTGEERLGNDWFTESSVNEDGTGNCIMSFNRIKRRSHAFRIPLLGGGWKGCFDSIENARNFLEASLKLSDEDSEYLSSDEVQVKLEQFSNNELDLDSIPKDSSLWKALQLQHFDDVANQLLEDKLLDTDFAGIPFIQRIDNIVPPEIRYSEKYEDLPIKELRTLAILHGIDPDLSRFDIVPELLRREGEEVKYERDVLEGLTKRQLQLIAERIGVAKNLNKDKLIDRIMESQAE